MTAVTVDVPHKSLFAGAYLVLDGHPSLTVAIPPRLQLRWAPEGEWDPDNPFANATHTTVSQWFEEQGIRFPKGSYSTVVSEETHGWGLGSSAAFTTALTAAYLQAQGLKVDKQELFVIARHAHRLGQGGKGSGADIAACTFGGVVSMEGGQNGQGEPVVESLQWPEQLGMVLIRGEQKADTRKLIQQYRDASQSSAVNALVEAIHQTRQSFRDGTDILLAMRQLAILEERWSLETGLPLSTPLLQTLQRASRSWSSSLVIKSLGGGGGDSIGCFYDKTSLPQEEVLRFFADFPVDTRPVFPETAGLTYLSSETL